MKQTLRKLASLKGPNSFQLSMLKVAYCAESVHRLARGYVGSVAFAGESSVWAAESHCRCLPPLRPPPPDAAGCTSSAQWQQWETQKCWNERSPTEGRVNDGAMRGVGVFCTAINGDLRWNKSWPSQGLHSCQNPALTNSWWDSDPLRASWTGHLEHHCTGSHLKK